MRRAVSADAEMKSIGEYDEIERPPVKPHVVRHRRFACRCAHRGAGIKAPAPAVAAATPFGPRIHALAIYLKGFQALSQERQRFLFRDAFGLTGNEGARMAATEPEASASGANGAAARLAASAPSL
jgi:transposase